MTNKTKVYSFDYVVSGVDGKQIDASQPGQPMLFMEGQGQIIPSLEAQIKLLKVGEAKSIPLKAADAYGEIDKSLMFDVPKAQLPPSDNLKVGDHFWAETDHGRRPFKVLKVSGDTVTMDGNHPLAGQDLSFEVKLVAVRDATAEEMTHGHAHGPGGHHH